MRYVVYMLLFALPSFVSAASMYIDTHEKTYGIGDTFIANVRLLTDAECVNAADVRVEFPHDTLKAVDFSKGSSILSLWVREPEMNNTEGVVSFAGGIPGGYCGRVQGDPALSNVLGRIAFTVVGNNGGSGEIRVGFESRLYAHDGLGTEITPRTDAITLTLSADRQLSENEWITEVEDDTTPPEAFTVEVQSTRGVFGGRYYLVFATQDKQSGLDHYEFNDRGGWKTITSPYELRRSSLKDIQVRAIDKAGNERLADYNEANAPELQASTDFSFIIFALILLVLLIAYRYFMRRPDAPITPPSSNT